MKPRHGIDSLVPFDLSVQRSAQNRANAPRSDDLTQRLTGDVLPRPLRRRAPSGIDVLVLSVVTVGSLVVALGLIGFVPRLPALALLGLPLVGGVAALTLIRFEWIVLGLLFGRATLDVFSTVDGSGPPVSAALGGFFLLIGGLWLLVQRLGGVFVPMSMATKSMVCLAGVVLLSVASAERFSLSLGTGSRVVAGLLMFLVLEQLLARGSISREQLVLVVMGSAVLPVLYGLVQILGPTPIDPITGLPRISSTFVHPNALASYLVMVIVLGAGSSFGFARRIQIPIFLLVFASGFVVVFTYTRIAYLAAIGGIAYLGVRRSRALLGALVLAVVCALVLVPSILARFSDLSGEPINDRTPANSIEWRLLYWERLSPLLWESPATGIGVGMVRQSGGRIHAPHNVWLQLGVEVGVPGVLAGLGMVGATALDLRRREKQVEHAAEQSHAIAASAVGLAFLSQTASENLLDSTLLWWYLAAALALGSKRRPSVQAEQRPRLP